MNKKIDEETVAVLLEALENAKAYSQQLQENREKRLWKKVDLPCSLNDAINRLTKAEMDIIRKNYDLRNLSSLSKAELATELAKLIPLEFMKIIYTLDQGRYGFIKEVIKNSGVVPARDISLSNVEAFMGYSIIFPGLYNDQKVLFIPNELLEIFARIDNNELENIVQRNTEWIRLTHGLLYYYGVLDISTINEKIGELTGQEVDIAEFMRIMFFACDFYGQARCTKYGFQDVRVFDAKKIVDEHRRRPDIAYYPFTKEQLLKAGEPGFVDKTPEMNRFIKFLLKHCRLSDQETNEIAWQLTNMINADARPSLIIQYLQGWMEFFPSLEFVQQLIVRITELHNNTRQWVLKGHTPRELLREEKKYLQPLPAEPFRINMQNSKVTDRQTHTKVGRNDHCPCGSGKKYKKCCGK